MDGFGLHRMSNEETTRSINFSNVDVTWIFN